MADRGVAKDSVITTDDILAIREQLGEPHDFADDEKSSQKDDEDWRDNLFTRGKDDTKPAKKFYRDEQNGILGGLAAGLAAYTGWDVVLWRIIFLILIPLTSGFAILVYIVMWIVAPEAKTASEKLEMRGEPVNLDSIKETARNFGEKAGDAAKSTAEIAKNSGPKIGNTILRIILAFVGIGFLFTAISVFAGTIIGGVTLINATAVAGIVSSGILIFATVILGIIAGIAFATVWLVLALASFAGKFKKGLSKTLLVSVIVCVVGGVAAIGTSVTWFFTAGAESAQQTWEKIENVYNPNLKYSVDKLNISAGKDVEIIYHAGKNETAIVNGITPESAVKSVDVAKSIEQNSIETRVFGSIMIDWNNDILNVKVDENWRATCGETCPEKLMLEITGPMAETVKISDATLKYETRDQNDILVIADKSANVTLSGDIKRTVDVSANSGANVDATDLRTDDAYINARNASTVKFNHR